MILALLAATLLESGAYRLELAGYTRTLAAIQSVRIEGLERRDAGLAATVLRGEWRLGLGEHMTLEAHQRVGFMTSASAVRLAGFGAGLGVSIPPGRSVDLSTEFFDRDDLRLDHDVDRLVLRLFFEKVDVTLGRQAIGWGTAMLMQVADLWTTFSPFELDTSQKRGIDAARATTPLWEGAEMELIVADRGTLRDLSAGARMSLYLPVVDVWFAAAKMWREVMLLAGAAAEAGAFKLRADALVPYDLDDREIDLPRATVGADWFHADVVLTLEGHFNGAGAPGGRPYLSHALASKELARGETYLLGRWYAGAAVSWRISEPLAVAASAIGNVRDPSAMVSLALVYSPTQAAQLAIGGFQGLGALPKLGAVPELPSEYGAYGGLYYLELSAYF